MTVLQLNQAPYGVQQLFPTLALSPGPGPTLWCWIAPCRPDGDLTGLDEADIEAAAEWGELQPTGKTSYAVYISLKQWRKVEPKLKDPADTLIIEGVPLVDEDFNGISVMATNTSTRKLKQEQAAALQAKSQPSA